LSGLYRESRKTPMISSWVIPGTGELLSIGILLLIMRLTLVSEASSELRVDGEALEGIPPSATVMNASMAPSLRLTDVLHGDIAISRNESWERGEEAWETRRG